MNTFILYILFFHNNFHETCKKNIFMRHTNKNLEETFNCDYINSLKTLIKLCTTVEIMKKHLYDKNELTQ